MTVTRRQQLLLLAPLVTALGSTVTLQYWRWLRSYYGPLLRETYQRSRIDIFPLFAVSRHSIVEWHRPDDISCCWRHSWRHTGQWPCIIEGRDCLLLKNVLNNWATVFLFAPLVMSNMTLVAYFIVTVYPCFATFINKRTWKIKYPIAFIIYTTKEIAYLN